VLLRRSGAESAAPQHSLPPATFWGNSCVEGLTIAVREEAGASKPPSNISKLCACPWQSIFAPCHCLCHAAVPCGTCCNEEGTQCYYAWVYCSGAHGMGVIASDGGKKFATDWSCMSCGEYVLEDAPTGAPPTIAMER